MAAADFPCNLSSHSLSIACLEGRCHLQPLRLCPPPEWKILLCLEGMDSAIPDPMATSSQVFPMCGQVRKHPQHQPSQSLTISTYCDKNSKGSQHLPHSTVSGSPKGWSSWPIRWRCFNCKGRWTQTMEHGCSWLRLPWTPATDDSWCWMLILPCATMRHRLH